MSNRTSHTYLTFLFVTYLVLFSLVSARAETIVNGDITSDTTWNLDGSPFIVSGNVAIQTNVTLTVEPGVEIKFDSSASLDVYGTVQCNGTNSQKILFTSNQNDHQPGDWTGIRMWDGSSGTFQYCVIEYASTGIYMYQDASSNITHCTFRQNTRGIELRNRFGEIPVPIINYCSFLNNTDYNLYLSTEFGWSTTTINAKYNWWGSVDLNEISNGIYDYQDNGGMAVVDFSYFLDGENGTPVTHTSSGETYLIGGTTGDLTLSGIYFVPSYFKIQPNHTLTIEPGTVIRFANGAYLDVSGGAQLSAIGDANNPITFTSHSETPQPGDWTGIRIWDNASGTLQYCVIEYASTGIYMYKDVSSNVTYCTFTNNTKGIELRNHFGEIPVTSINYCSFTNNSKYNLYISTEFGWAGTTINAENNWWGTQNPDEIAETIWDHNDDSNLALVDFDPWLHNIADDDGPYVSEIKFNGAPVSSGDTINKPGTFSLYAVDTVSGISRVEFYINDELKITESKTSGSFSFFWNIVEIPDGSYNFTVKAFDTLGNLTEVTLDNLQVTLNPPDTPTITYPTQNLLVSRKTISVQGSSELYTEISVYNNDILVVTGIEVNPDGSFAISIPLTEGENSIELTASHRGGTSPRSTPVTVIMDPNALSPPVGVTLTPKENGILRLSWGIPPGEIPAGYNIYRSTVPFTAPEEATRINSEPVTGTIYEDIPGEENTYYYALTSVDIEGNESDLSNVVHGTADSTSPFVQSIEWTTNGNYDQATGRVGIGTLSITLTVNEKLKEVPYLAIVPHDSTPVPIALSQESDRVYTGSFEITEDIPSGTAFFNFSGKDIAGNRGTAISGGNSLEIDTNGPRVTELNISPAAPIKNNHDSPVNITVTIILDETPTDEPLLFYSYNETSGEIPITGLTQIDTLTWEATFTLAPEAGINQGDLITFHFQAKDNLDNVSNTIECLHSFEVYQETLPPLDSPKELSGEAQAEGTTFLKWTPVEGAAYYRIYRQAPGESGLTLYKDHYNQTQFSETTETEGEYVYAVTSIRIANGDISESSITNTVTVNADATPPAPPSNLALELIGSGIKATWIAPSGEDKLRYRLYRSSSIITSVEGLNAVTTTGENQLSTIDYHPSINEHYYAVTAIDNAGNESSPSNCEYLNFQLLPVSELTVRLAEGSAPVITWADAGESIKGYNVYVRKNDKLIKLNQNLITETHFTDETYTGTETSYAVTCVDNNDTESIGRFIEVPSLIFYLAEEQKLYRKKINDLVFTIENTGTSDINNLNISVKATDIDVQSDQFEVPANQREEQKIVLGSSQNWEDHITLTATLEYSPEEGEKVQFVKDFDVSVDDYAPVVDLLIDNVVRGDNTRVKIKIFNDTDQQMEVITGSDGNSATSEIHLQILDEDGNVLSSKDLYQITGDNIIAAGSVFIANIPAGSYFLTSEIEIPLPLNAPDKVIFKVAIDHFYYHYGRANQIEVEGLENAQDIFIVDTTYYAEVTSITPEISRGEGNITIVGHAVSRKSGEELPYAMVKLGISVNGFDKYIDLATDADGKFIYTYVPTSGECGIYSVWAQHPDLNFKTEQATFTIQKLYAPDEVIKNITRGVSTPINIEVQASQGTIAHNLNLEIEGTLPQGITLTLPSPVNLLESGEKAILTFEIEADESSAESGEISFKLVSDETSENFWKKISFKYNLVEGKGLFISDPSYIEVGVKNDTSTNSGVTITNVGTADLSNVYVSLQPPEGKQQLDWIQLGVPELVRNVGIGESFNVTIIFEPSNVSEGLYEYTLKITTPNGPDLNVPIYVSVTSSETGAVKFHVSDIYTNTLDENGNLIKGVEGAKIRIQNSSVPTLIYDTITSDSGFATFENIPVGRYDYRITAPDHTTTTGTVHISPGIIISEESFLPTSLITFEWEVVPITINDTYTLKLKATFETDVPAPVLVCEPSSVTLPEMSEGEVFYGEFRIINHGLVRADEVSVLVPTDDPYYTYEIPNDLPDSIDAKSELIVPYRIVCKKSPSPGDEKDTGGAGSCHVACIAVPYSFFCANDFKSLGSTRVCFNTASLDCGSGELPVIHAPYSKGAKTSSTLSTVKGSPPCPPKDKPEDCDKKAKTGSGVTLASGLYYDSVVDLKVKVNGGFATASRIFVHDHWEFGENSERITPVYSFDEKSFRLIKKGHVEYEKVAELGSDEVFENSELANYQCGTSSDNGHCYSPKNYLFKNRNFTIKTLGGYIDHSVDSNGNPLENSGKFHCMGYLWQSPDGTWKKYDDNGRVIAMGYNTLSFLRFAYDEEGKLVKILDSRGQDAITYEYTGDVITAVTDRAGHRVEYEYTDGRLTKVTDVLGYDWLYEYDNSGKMIQKTDPLGHKTHITYDYAGRVASVVDENGIGKFFEYKFDEANQLYYSRVETSGGLIKEIWFDKNIDVKKVAINGNTVLQIFDDLHAKIFVDGEGNRTIKKYNDKGKITQIIYPDGSVETFEYDGSGKKLIRHTDQLGKVTTYSYNENGFLKEILEDDGNGSPLRIDFTYDDQGNILTVNRVAPDDSRDSVTYEYDEYGNRIKKIDAEGNIITATYDALGNPVSLVDARGNEWKQTYNAKGQLLTKENPLGQKIISEYDPLGNMISITFPSDIDPEGAKYELRYDCHNRIIEITGPDGNKEKYEYNSDGKKIKFIDGEGKTTTYTYDTLGRLIKEIDGNGNVTAYNYNLEYSGGCPYCGLGGNSSLVKEIIYPTYTVYRDYDPVGRKTLELIHLDNDSEITTSYEYDLDNRRITVTDGNGHNTTYDYDGFGKIISIRHPLDQTIAFGFNWRGDMTSITDPLDHVVSMEYNKNDLLIKETSPMGSEISRIYDESGNVIEQTYPNGAKTVLGYDAANRLINLKSFSPEGNPEEENTFSYNPAGSLTSYANNSVSGQCSYDALQRKVSESVRYGEVTASYSYEYYKNGKVKSLSVTDNTGSTYIFDYVYDPANNLSAIKIDSFGAVNYSEYQWKKPRKKIFPGGITEAIEYDSLMRVTGSLLRKASGEIMAQYTYTYDNVGNVLSSSRNGTSISYSYDALDRLILANRPGENDERYTYDLAGNRLSDHRYPTTWQYNANNQLVAYGEVSLVYDENGSLKEKRTNGNPTLSLSYDSQNHLREVKDGSGNTVAKYFYDPFGRRIKKETDGKTIYYLYSNEGLLAELDETGTFKKVYVYKPQSKWSSAPVALIENGTCYFYHNSPSGTPLELFSASGEIVWSASYESFGKATVDSKSSIVNNLRFPGQYYDAETGLHYNFKRYYDPEIGRYINEDPTRFEGSLNLYEYARNNPLRFTDPTGEIVSFGLDVGLGPIGGGIAVSAVECCNNNYYMRYWLASYKIGVGWITGVTVGVSFAQNEPGKCPPSTGCSVQVLIGGGVGPLGGSCDVLTGNCSGGFGVGGFDISVSFMAGAFYECKYIKDYEFLRCCDEKD